MNSRFLAAAVVVGFLHTTATAGTLDLDAVSAEATWMVHVDVERFAESTVGRFLREHGDELDIDMGDLEEMQEHLGVDPWRDVISVTVYGTDDDEDDGVMVLVTNDRVDGALRRLARLEGVEHDVETFDRYDTHVFAWEGEQHYVHVHETRSRDRVVVIADDADMLIAACRVLDGRDRSLARDESPLVAMRPRRGSFAFLAASDVGMFEDVEPASEIVRLTDAVVIDIGETKGNLYASATVSADNRDDARDIVQVLQGMLALGRLAAGEDEDLAPLRDVIRGVRIDADGPRIMLGIELPTKKLIEALEELDDDKWDKDHDDKAHDGDDDEDHDRRDRRVRERQRRR